MKVITQIKEEKHEFDFSEQDIREGFDFAIRHNPKFWEVVRDLAGRYQAELMTAELKRRKLFKVKRVKS